MIEERIELSTLIIWLRALHDQQFPRYLKLQQKKTNVRVLTNNKNGVLLNDVHDILMICQ